MVKVMTLNELFILLTTAQTVEEIDDRKDEISELIPQVKRMFAYNQHNDTHPHTLWMHCVQTVINLPKGIDDAMLYLAALLHDIGKPDCQVKGTREGDVNMHYYGHPIRSMEIVRDTIIPQLRENGYFLSEDDKRRLLYYVEYHDDRVSLRLKHLRRHLKMASLEEFQKLMQLEVADAKAHVLRPTIISRLEICEQLAGEYSVELYERIMNGE